MEGKRVHASRSDEMNFKKALLNRYLEDQVLYNRQTAPARAPKTLVSTEDVVNEEKSSSLQTNDVIVKINDELTSPDLQNQSFSQSCKVERRKISLDPSTYEENHNKLTAVHAKLSRSLDEDHFKSLYLDIPNQSEIPCLDAKTGKRRDLKRPQLHIRKYSDCSNNWTKSFQNSCAGRLNTADKYAFDVHDHPTNTLARGILKKMSLPCSGATASERKFGRKQVLSLASFEGSIHELSHLKDGDAHRMSMASFKSSCSSFPEVEFGDSDYDRSCASSPCSPLNGTCRFPPINNENNYQ